MTKLLRVALVVPSLRGGGLERVVRDLALGLDRERFEPRVYGVGGLGVYAADLAAAGVATHDCREGSVAVRGIPMRLTWAIAAFRPHVIHAHSGAWYPSSVAKVLSRTPVLLYTEHGRYPPEPRGRALVERWCAARTDGLYAVARGTAEYLRRFLGLRDLPEVLPNGVDLSLYRPSSPESRGRMRRLMGIAPGEVVGISVGRFVPVKNHEGIITALASLPRTLRLRLVFVGQGELEPAMRLLVERAGLSNSVLFLGYRTDVVECLGAADFFVNASTTEGLPVSILEAMATGLPVVATKVGGVPDILGEPPAGLLVESGDGVGLSKALRVVAEDGELRARLSERALNQAGRYSIGAFVRAHENIYEAAAGTSPRSGRS